MRKTWLAIPALCALFAGAWHYTGSNQPTEARAESETAAPPLPQDTLKYIDSVAVKHLAATDIDPKTSHQHEITGVKALQRLFGTQKQELRARFMYYGDREFSTDVGLTWYDASRDPKKQRWRLYYQENPVIKAAKPKDSLVLARYGKDNVLAIIAPHGTKYEAALFKVFGIKEKVSESGITLPFTPPKEPKLINAVHEQLQQTGKIPVDVSLWKDVETGEVTVEGKVEAVKDGDTLNVAGVFDIRLIGIDAPEKKQTCMRDGAQWDCGEEAKQYLTSLALGKQAHCTNRKKEKYGRFLSVCEVGGKSLNAAMIEHGLAVIYYSDEFADVEKKARLEHLGLWNSEFVNPEDFRRAH